MKRKTVRFTFEERQKIQEILDAGGSYALVCRTIGRHPDTLRNERGRCKGKYNALEAQANADINRKQQNLSQRRAFTPEEDVILHKMVREKNSLTTMRKVIGVREGSILAWLMKNAPDFEPDSPLRASRKRIDALEQQMEIVLDVIKELRKQ
jgi:IS30 family transposase